MKKALFLNFLSALTCYAGLYLGVAVGSEEYIRQWIFAAVAGGFLYVALVHMVIVKFFLKNAFFACNFAFIEKCMKSGNFCLSTI